MGMEELFELEAFVSAPRSSVPFRGRLFAFVVQTGRLFFTWHRPRCIFSSHICSPASHWLSCFITGRSLFLTGYCQRTLSKFRITISNAPQPPPLTTTKPAGPNTIVAHVRYYYYYYAQRQAALCHLPPTTSHPSNKIRPFRVFSGDGNGRPLRVLEAPVSAPRSSVLFRGRLFAFVLQTSRIFFTWHRSRCIFSSYIFHQQAIG